MDQPTKIEMLLDRIALALEKLVEQTSRSRGETLLIPPPVSNPSPNSFYPVNNNVTHLDSSPTPAANTIPINTEPAPVSFLEAFLNSKGIRIKTLPQEDPSDQVIDSLSLFLGERYHALSSLLSKIKRGMQNGSPITENLAGRPQEDMSSVCQFCTRLHEVAFLESYHYLRSPIYIIKAKTTTLPKAQRFFGGQWLERFILQKIKGVYSQISSEITGQLAFDYLVNPQIILPNGDDFELDILARIGDSIYWTEAKSGDYQQHVAKYSRFARLLGLDFEHSFMVLTDVPKERCDALSSLFSMTVSNANTFESQLLSVVRKDTARIASTESSV
jgi:hypothetical protein